MKNLVFTFFILVCCGLKIQIWSEDRLYQLYVEADSSDHNTTTLEYKGEKYTLEKTPIDSFGKSDLQSVLKARNFLWLRIDDSIAKRMNKAGHVFLFRDGKCLSRMKGVAPVQGGVAMESHLFIEEDTGANK